MEQPTQVSPSFISAHKSFVEILYRNQLMKAVFATETLAAGINMPGKGTCGFSVTCFALRI